MGLIPGWIVLASSGTVCVLVCIWWVLLERLVPSSNFVRCLEVDVVRHWSCSYKYPARVHFHLCVSPRVLSPTIPILDDMHHCPGFDRLNLVDLPCTRVLMIQRCRVLRSPLWMAPRKSFQLILLVPNFGDRRSWIYFCNYWILSVVSALPCFGVSYADVSELGILRSNSRLCHSWSTYLLPAVRILCFIRIFSRLRFLGGLRISFGLLIACPGIFLGLFVCLTGVIFVWRTEMYSVFGGDFPTRVCVLRYSVARRSERLCMIDKGLYRLYWMLSAIPIHSRLFTRWGRVLLLLSRDIRD